MREAELSAGRLLGLAVLEPRVPGTTQHSCAAPLLCSMSLCSVLSLLTINLNHIPLASFLWLLCTQSQFSCTFRSSLGRKSFVTSQTSGSHCFPIDVKELCLRACRPRALSLRSPVLLNVGSVLSKGCCPEGTLGGWVPRACEEGAGLIRCRAQQREPSPLQRLSSDVLSRLAVRAPSVPGSARVSVAPPTPPPPWVSGLALWACESRCLCECGTCPSVLLLGGSVSLNVGVSGHSVIPPPPQLSLPQGPLGRQETGTTQEAHERRHGDPV